MVNSGVLQLPDVPESCHSEICEITKVEKSLQHNKKIVCQAFVQTADLHRVTSDVLIGA